MEQERVCYRGSHTRLLEPEAEPGETRFCSVWWRAKRECERERVREREREREKARERGMRERIGERVIKLK